MVPIIDVIIILFLAGFVFYGLFFGFIKMVGYLAGLIIGSWIASHFYLIFYEWFKWLFFGYENAGKIISFILVLTIVSRLVGIGFYLIEKIFNVLSIIPFLKSFNKIAGAIFGFIEGTFTFGLIIYVASRYTLIDSFLGKQLSVSVISPFLMKLVNILTPLFPEALKVLKSIVQI
ncbi:MAG: CvpA family protein [Candidatus Falkowbacteria bacterium]